MLIIIENVLSPEEVVAAQRFMVAGQFRDGKLTAGKMAAGIKNNLEMDQGSDLFSRLNGIAYRKLIQHPIYQAGAMPRKTAAPFYVRYTQGMQYGYHVDDPIMGEGPRFRSDVSSTLFLNNPDEYEGGELQVSTPFGEQSVKLPAGSAVIYPSSSLHQVTEVTSGERMAMVMWAQSMVRAPDQRELLFDLWQSREALLHSAPDDAETKRIDRAYANLVRMWADV